MQNGTDKPAKEALTSPVVSVQVHTSELEADLATLRAKSVKVFMKEQITKRLKAKADIAKAEYDIEHSEYVEALMEHKVKYGMPLDKGVNLINNEPV